MKILMVGDIVGSPGRSVFKQVVGRMKDDGEVDFVVANAENAAGGRGLSSSLAEELFDAGADVITLGDHTWDQKDLGAYMGTEERVVRPLNFSPGCPGRGFVTLNASLGRISVVNIIGRVFMKEYDCPYRAMDMLLKNQDLGSVVLVDFHAEATSEKVVMGRYLEGRVSAVVGTHTHVQTSDEMILKGGTAYITDLGMTGPKDSAIGRDLDQVKHIFLTGIPSAFKVAKGDVKLEGVIIDVDRTTGKAAGIIRIREALQE